MSFVWPPGVGLNVILYESVQVIWDRKIKIQAVLIFTTELKFRGRTSQSEHQRCRFGKRGPR